jgi:DNA-binding GntR family transcriptional regulator
VSPLRLEAAPLFMTLEEYVANKLREAILKGYLKPGEKLDQNEIAELLGVSRSPVRDALRKLAAEGLVQIHPYRGAIVAELSPEELEEIYMLRRVLEGLAARLAVPYLDAERLTVLEEILQAMDETEDADAWIELNYRFHHIIYEAARRPRLLALIDNLRNIVAPYIRQYISTPEYRQSAQASHRRILEACVRRDAVAAQRETEEHLQAVVNGVLIASRPMEAAETSSVATKGGSHGV